jgi:hypothetical protein
VTEETSRAAWLDALSGLPDEELMAELTAIPGAVRAAAFEPA